VWGSGLSMEVVVVGDGQTGIIIERESGNAAGGWLSYSGNFAVEEMEKQRCARDALFVWTCSPLFEKGHVARDT
jgi:hypothetical protein